MRKSNFNSRLKNDAAIVFTLFFSMQRLASVVSSSSTQQQHHPLRLQQQIEDAAGKGTEMIDQQWNQQPMQQYEVTEGYFGMYDDTELNRQLQSDETICNSILSTFLYDDNSFSESMTPCACERETESLIETVDIDPVKTTRVIPGTFGVNCNYEYCRQCTILEDDGKTEICGEMLGNSTYTENMDNPTSSEFSEGKECVEFTSSTGNSTFVCKRTFIDYNLNEACEIQVGEGYYISNCKSCDFVTCNDEEQIAFDCTNVEGLYEFNPCNDTDTTNATIADPSIWFFDPLSHFNPNGKIQFDSCFDPAAPSSSSVTPGPSPTKSSESPVATASVPSLAPVKASTNDNDPTIAKNSTDGNTKRNTTTSDSKNTTVGTDSNKDTAATSAGNSILGAKGALLLLSLLSILSCIDVFY